MARVVCQVVPRAERLTFIWSAGTAAFEPYHLAGAEQSAFDTLAAQARQALAGSPAELTALGQRLYRALFRLDATDGDAAQAVNRWLAELQAQGQLEALEFVGGAPGAIPWNVLHDGSSCWGTRFNLACPRRTHPLRFAPAFVAPTALLAADGGLLDQLSGAERAGLDGWRDERLILGAADHLASQLRQRTPDVLVLLARVEGDGLRLGGQRVTPAELREWIGETRDGNPNPLIFLGAAGAPDQAATWEGWLAAAAAELDGLVTNIVPLAPAAAIGAAVAAAERFLHDRRPLGGALAETRAALGAAGLALTAFCPALLHVAEAEEADAVSELPRQPLPDEPYCPLRPYGPAERPLFFGREEETLRLAALLDQDSTAGVILHGSAAVGKTSLVQAGLWPYLEQECVGFRLIADRTPEEAPAAEGDYPPLVIRPGSDLAGQLADALFLFCAQPLTYATPTGQTVTIDLPAILASYLGTPPSTAIQTPPARTASPEETAIGIAEPGHEPAPAAEEESGPGPQELWQALRDDPARLGRLLDELTRRLPFELVVTIDEGDDLVNLVRSPLERERRRQALDMLLAVAESAARCKFLLVLRTEYFGQLAGVLPARSGRAMWQEFFLDELGEATMADALLGPTSREEVLYTDEVPHAKYGFSYEEGLAQQLVSDILAEAHSRQYGPLSLLQVVGAMLVEERVVRRRQAILRASDLRDIGGVRGALARYVSQRIDKLPLPSTALKGLRGLVQRLTTRHTDGRITRDVVSARVLKDTWRSNVPIEQAVNTAAERAGLFAIDPLLVGGEPGLYVSLAHDSIAQAGRLWGKTDAGGGGTKRSGVIDTLWIMIPLAMLAAVLTWYFTRSHYAEEFKGLVAEFKTEMEKVETQVQEYHTETRLPLYRGEVARAEQLLDHGNALGARQLLLSDPALSPDPRGTKLRGFEWDYLWNRTNAERHNLEGHGGTVSALAVSSDGQLAASASLDKTGTVRLWRVATGQAAALIEPGKGPLHAVALSPDGKTVAAAGAGKAVYLWDLSALKDDFLTLADPTKSLSGHDGDVLALAFDKDGKTLASGGADHTVILWDVKAGTPRAKLKEHASRVQALAFAPDGKTLASGADEPGVILWTVESGKKAHTLATGLSAVAALAFAPDGKSLTAGGLQRLPTFEAGVARSWSLKADGTPGEPAATVAHGRAVLAVAYLPGGKVFATGGNDTVVRLWDVASGAEVGQRVGHLGSVAALAATGDGTLLSGSSDRAVKVWSAGASRSDQVVQAHKDWVQGLAFSLTTQGQVLISAGHDGTVKLWEPETGASLGELPAQGGAITALAVPTDPRVKPGVLAVSTWDDKNGAAVKVWELVREEKGPKYKGKELQAFKGPKTAIACLAFNRRGNRLAAGSADRTVVLWDVDTGKTVQTLAGHQAAVRSLSFADNRLLFTGGAEGAVYIWDSETGELVLREFPMHTDSVEGLDYLVLPVGKEEVHGVLSAGLDNQLHISTIGKGKLTERSGTRAANHPITCLLRRPSLAITGGWDGTVRLWGIELRRNQTEGGRLEFREQFTFTSHGGPVRTIALSIEQSVLAAGGRDGSIQLWRGLGAPAANRPPVPRNTK